MSTINLSSTINPLINIIINEVNKVVIFRLKCHSIASILFEIKNAIEKNQPLNDINQEDFTEIEKNSSNILELIQKLQNIEQFLSFINPDKSIQQPILDINECLSCIVTKLNKNGFAFSFIITSEIIYKDFVDMDELLANQKLKSDHLIQKRRDEIGEYFKRMKKPDLDAIFFSTDSANLAELTNHSDFKLTPYDYSKDKDYYFDNPLFECYLGKKTSNPQEKLRIMVLKDKSKFKRLFSILTSINHPYLESFVGACITDSIEIITRKSGANLKKLLSLKKYDGDNDVIDDDESFVYIDPGDRTIIAFKIAQAMAYLHSHGVIHRDLDTSIIYIKKIYSTKDGDDNNYYDVFPIITNFANSHLLSRNSILGMTNINSDLALSHFVAPELTDNPTYDEKVDVFAFAGILYEFLTKHPPFEEDILAGRDVWKKIKDGDRPDLPNDCSEELLNLIKDCWKQNPSDRPSFHAIIDRMLPKENSEMIIFPSDIEQAESIKNFYKQYLITSNSAIECLDTFEKIKESIGSAYQYRFEFFSARPFISNYQYLFCNSKYRSETNLTDKENEIIASLSNSLKDLHNIILNSTQVCWSKNACTTPVDLVTNQLNNNMNIIFDSLKNLGIDVSEKYQENNNDLVFDYRQLLSDFEDCIANLSERLNKPNPKNLKRLIDYMDKCKLRQKEITNFFKKKQLKGSITKKILIGQIKDLFSQFSQYEKNQNDFEIGSKIGSGMSSIVYSGYIKENQKEVVIKILKDDYLLMGESSLTPLSREIASLVRIHNDYVVDFIGFCIPEDKIGVWLIFEPVYLGKLKDNIQNLNGFHKTKIAFEIAEGMEDIHSKRIIHRDLNTSNILLDESLTPKITDFGYSRSNINDIVKTNQVGTKGYMAPEVIKGKYYGMQVDVYSYGMILWELEYNKHPFENSSNISNNNLEFGDECPEGLKQLILDCSNTDFKKRPTFTEIIERMMKKGKYIMFSDTDIEDIDDFYKEKGKQRFKNSD